LQLADDDSTSTLSLEKKREKMKTLAATGLFILRVCWSGRVAGKFCGAVGMPSSRGSLDRACVGVGRGSPRPTSGSARYTFGSTRKLERSSRHSFLIRSSRHMAWFFGAKEPFGSIRSSYVPPGTWHGFLELRNGAKEPFGSIRSSYIRSSYVPPGMFLQAKEPSGT
jgi:hypothetical protein